MKTKLLSAAVAAVIAFCGCTDENVPADSIYTPGTLPSSEPETVSRPDMPQHLEQQPSVLEAAGDEFYRLTGCRYPVYGNTQVEFYPMGEQFYEALLRELESAEDFIYMEFFICYEGEMLDGILEVLDRKIAEGVEVRLLVDALTQSTELTDSLCERGIDCRIFREPVSFSLNTRDHRKLAVIDGKTAFTGGINIGDEYINVTKPYGVWKDAAVMLRGDAVRSCTEIFFEQWDGGSGLGDCGELLDLCEPADAEGFVMPYAESPHDGLDSAYDIYMELIDSAEERLYITAPYLNIDDDFRDAICAAAQRGVEVVMIVPAVNDQFYMQAIAKTHFRALVESGVKLYRYDPGFIHAKIFCCDGQLATVGSVNLTNRSFYLDYECGVLLYGTECIADIEEDILNTLAECTLFTEDNLPELTPAEQAEAGLFLQFKDVM